jgi:hypothetical protein
MDATIRVAEVGAARGAAWLTEGFSLFRARPLAWIALCSGWIAITFALIIVPIIGGVIANFLQPVFFASFAVIAYRQRAGEPIVMGDLFTGFKHNMRALVNLGALLLLAEIAIFALMAVLGLPLTGSPDWADMDGVTIVTKIWGGRANLAEFKADGPAGHLELLSLRTYNPMTGQWSLNFATPKVGKLGVPGVGEFKNGRGDFYDLEPINGKSVLVKFSIWGITADSAQSEQAFSDDGGKTWEVNWINRYTRDRR